jgi:hypothetical protein
MKYEIDRNVLSAVHDERVFQNRKWGSVTEHPHEVGGYLTIMRKLLTDAEVAWASSRGDEGSLDEIRKVVAVGIACLEQHGAVIRDPQTFIALAASTGKYSHSVNGE